MAGNDNVQEIIKDIAGLEAVTKVEPIVPDDFWPLNAYYIIAESINAFAVAVNLGQEEIDYSEKMMKTTLEWFDGFNNLVPSWYKE